MSDLASLLQQQPMLTGMVGLAATGGALFALRALPKALWTGLKEAACVSLVIDSDDQVFDYLSVWLARHDQARLARRLMVAQAYNYDRGEWGWEITLGRGWHLLFAQSRPLLVHREVQDPEALARAVGAGRRQRMTLLSLGRSQTTLRTLIAAAKDVYLGVGLSEVRFWSQGGYQLADKRATRSLDTVFLPPGQKARLVADLQAFVGAQEAYRRRGVPWRRGYLLEGPPGTGKTTLIHVLSALIGRSIHVLNLSNLGGDNELISAVNAVGRDGVLVIEDIDGVKITRDRDLSDAPSGRVGSEVPGLVISAEPARRGVTLSGLLNAIDGVTAREGRILFITTNRPEQLDPALLRAGRVDVREHIDRLARPEAQAMHRAFRSEAAPGELEALTGGRFPIAAAELQGLLLELEARASAPACEAVA